VSEEMHEIALQIRYK